MVIWKRKVYRVVIGSIFPGVYLITGSIFWPLLLVSFFLTLVLAMEYERWSHPQVWSYLLNRFSVFKKASQSLTGDTFFILACFFLVLFFPAEIAIAGLLFLTYGDAASALIGTYWGSTAIFPGKSLEGFLGSLAINTVLAGLIMGVLPVAPITLVSGALVASVVESLPLKMDDNLSVGLISSVIMGGIEFLQQLRS
ncbi:MAG: hypothetical protein NC911_07170 [Candidatus Omnitrophica bacterium]|nr:hypothetical protein [Candidatus Omnitrophota bacterium]